MNDHTLKISKKDLTTMGDCSLVGLLAERQNIIPPCSLTIQFEETSLEWRERNGGADEIIIPEYVPACLCRDIVWLMKTGFEISIESYTP